MYIYLFVILPIFYSIIIYLLFIFLIIYWLATVGDLCRRPTVGDLASAQIAEITTSTAENTYSTTRVTYRDLLRQSKRSESLVGECRRPRRQPGRQQENSWTHLCGRIRVYSHMQDFISTLSRTHQLLRPILTYLPSLVSATLN